MKKSELNVGDIIYFPSEQKMEKTIKGSNQVVVIRSKVSRRKTIKIKSFLWFKDISLSFNCPKHNTDLVFARLRTAPPSNPEWHRIGRSDDVIEALIKAGEITFKETPLIKQGLCKHVESRRT